MNRLFASCLLIATLVIAEFDGANARICSERTCKIMDSSNPFCCADDTCCSYVQYVYGSRTHKSLRVIGGAVIIVFLIASIAGCVCCCCRRNRSTPGTVVMAVPPVIMQQQHPTGQYPAAQPVYKPGRSAAYPTKGSNIPVDSPPRYYKRV